MERRSFLGSLIGYTIAAHLPFIAEKPKLILLDGMHRYLAAQQLRSEQEFGLIIHTDEESIQGTKLLNIDSGNGVKLQFDGVDVVRTMVVKDASITNAKGEILFDHVKFPFGAISLTNGDRFNINFAMTCTIALSQLKAC